MDVNIFDLLNEGVEENVEENEEEKGDELADELIERLRSNLTDNLILTFDEECINHLTSLYESLLLGQTYQEAVPHNPTLIKIYEEISNLKFVMDFNRTGKLWLQFMDFVSIIRMFIRAERTGNWKLHLHACEKMLPFLAAAGHKYVMAVRKYMQDVHALCQCMQSRYDGGLFTIWCDDKLFWRWYIH